MSLFHGAGRSCTSPGMINRTAKRMATAPAVWRTMAPTPTAMTPISTMFDAPPSTARRTPGSVIDTPACLAASRPGR
jgi:hypothetical protein